MLLWEDDMLKGWKHWINSPGHGGTAQVYRLFLPTGWRGLFHNVLSLSPYLELRERFPYLTHSCKSQMNSSNSGTRTPNASAFNLDLGVQPRLKQVWRPPPSQIYWPHHLQRLQQALLSSERENLQKLSLEHCLVTKSYWLFYLASQNYTVYTNQKEFLIFLLMQQLNFLSTWVPVYARCCPCRTQQSSLCFVVPLHDFLWCVLIWSRLVKPSPGLIFGQLQMKSSLAYLYLFAYLYFHSQFGFGEAEDERFLKCVQNMAGLAPCGLRWRLVVHRHDDDPSITLLGVCQCKPCFLHFFMFHGATWRDEAAEQKSIWPCSAAEVRVRVRSTCVICRWFMVQKMTRRVSVFVTLQMNPINWRF